MFYLHNAIGTYLEVKSKSKELAIKKAKEYNIPVSVSELKKFSEFKFGSNEYFELTHVHIPKGKSVEGTHLSWAMLDAEKKKITFTKSE